MRPRRAVRTRVRKLDSSCLGWIVRQSNGNDNSDSFLGMRLCTMIPAQRIEKTCTPFRGHSDPHGKLRHYCPSVLAEGVTGRDGTWNICDIECFLGRKTGKPVHLCPPLLTGLGAVPQNVRWEWRAAASIVRRSPRTQCTSVTRCPHRTTKANVLLLRRVSRPSDAAGSMSSAAPTAHSRCSRKSAPRLRPPPQTRLDGPHPISASRLDLSNTIKTLLISMVAFQRRGPPTSSGRTGPSVLFTPTSSSLLG